MYHLTVIIFILCTQTVFSVHVFSITTMKRLKSGEIYRKERCYNCYSNSTRMRIKNKTFLLFFMQEVFLGLEFP